MNSIQSILIVESDDDQAAVILRAIEGAIDASVARAESLRSAQTLLANNVYDAVLLSLKLSDSSGADTVRALRDVVRNAPIIALCDAESMDDAVQATRAGAQDYVLKGPLAPFIISRALSHAVERHYLTSIIEDLRTRERDAYVDAVTGLINRKQFDQVLGQSIREARRDGQTLAVMFLDLDGFKAINDDLGHPFGDQVLRTVAKRLAALLRDSDILGRVGGDEFGIVLRNPGRLEDVAYHAGRMTELVRRPLAPPGREFTLGASIGIAMYDADGRNSDELMHCADLAMYQAKASGGNRYEFYSKEMGLAAAERLARDQTLRDAINNHEFELHYQPVLDLLTGQTVSLEALVRWQRPERGLLPAREFIPSAERSNLIVRIDDWVLNAACKDNKAWETSGRGALRTSVNLSARQFRRPDLVANVHRALQSNALPPDRLDLEIAESALMHEPDGAIKTLGALRELGVQISIDDFGRDYAALGYLRKLPAHVLKLDKSLVRANADSQELDSLSRSVVSFAHTLKVKVVAEGVEKEAELQWARELGCEHGQGFLLARPGREP